jgi:hypothetical protein
MLPERKPQSSVHRVLGEQQVITICQSFGLDERGIKIVNRILSRWEDATGDLQKKVQIAVEESGDYPNRLGILRAVTELSRQFILQNPAHPLSGYADKAKNN